MTIAIITECGLSTGMGHLSRTSRIAEKLISHGLFVDLYLINHDSINVTNSKPWVTINSIDHIKKKYKTTIIDIPHNITINISKETFGKIITLGQAIVSNDNIHSNIVSAYGNYINSTRIIGKTTHYLGAGYASLSEEYFTPKHKAVLKNSLLISFGGTDPKNYTEKLINAYAVEIKQNFSQITIVIGCGNKNAENIINKCKKESICIIQNTKTLQPLLDEHEYFLCSPGVSLFEAWSRNRYPHFICQNKSQRDDFLHFPGSIKSFDDLKKINILKNKIESHHHLKTLSVGTLLLPLIMELIND
ncbi:hypothetical protein [Plesiomonas sp.]|uniref:hypothetical protein n=1 Tax=Plesiomonas sp. TaxID=2486279 RepID=UPI003F3E1126